jgi:hypothetical protein
MDQVVGQALATVRRLMEREGRGVRAAPLAAAKPAKPVAASA